LTFPSLHLFPFLIPINAFNIIEETLNQTTVHQSFHAVNAAGDFHYAYCFLSILSAKKKREKVNINSKGSLEISFIGFHSFFYEKAFT